MSQWLCLSQENAYNRLLHLTLLCIRNTCSHTVRQGRETAGSLLRLFPHTIHESPSMFKTGLSRSNSYASLLLEVVTVVHACIHLNREKRTGNSALTFENVFVIPLNTTKVHQRFIYPLRISRYAISSPYTQWAHSLLQAQGNFLRFFSTSMP